MEQSPLDVKQRGELTPEAVNPSLIDSSTHTVTIICSRHPLDLTAEANEGFMDKVLNFLFNGGRRTTILDKRWD